jgi:hypothetical protein
MMVKTFRKYDSQYRKKLVNKIKRLDTKEDYIELYNIIISDIGTNFSSNINGLFLNVNLLSDKCIEKVNIYLDSKINIHQIHNVKSSDITITSYKSFDDINDNLNYKLSNQEKIIIKRFRSKENIDATI